jgi:tight adherence protein B
MLAQESGPAVAVEMRKVHDEWKLGMPWDRALDSLASRVPLTEVSVFAAAVKLNSRSGGRLGDVLATLADTLRESANVRGEVRAVSAHGRLTATVLTIIPIGIAVMMSNVNPEHLEILLRHPYGRHLIGAAAAALVLANLIMRRIAAVRL